MSERWAPNGDGSQACTECSAVRRAGPTMHASWCPFHVPLVDHLAAENRAHEATIAALRAQLATARAVCDAARALRDAWERSAAARRRYDDALRGNEREAALVAWSGCGDDVERAVVALFAALDAAGRG